MDRAADVRNTGIPIIGDVPWGTHFCQFYQDEKDLADLLLPYFKAGLEGNEFCMWVTSEPLGRDKAKAALESEIESLDEYFRKGQLAILDYRDWYTPDGTFDSDRVLRGWVRKLDDALQRGFDGLRLSGNTFWLEKSGWRDFTEYEAAVDAAIGRRRMIALCTYSLTKCGAAEIMDVVSNHAFALIKRSGKWELIESAERKRMELSLRESEEKLRCANAELEQRVAEQTAEIRRANEELERRVGERTSELARSEEQLRVAALAGNIGVWSWIPGTDHVEVSANWRRLFGVPPDVPVTFETWCNSLHEGDRERAVRELNAASERGQEFNTEYRVVRPDGSVHWMVDRGRALYDGNGRAVSMAGVNVDITERRLAEEALKRQRELLGVTLSSIGDAVLATDSSGKITFVNPVARRLTGWGDEALGCPVEDVLHLVNEETHEPAAAIVERVLREQTIVEMENHTSLVARDGREIPIEDTAAPIRDGQGHLAGVVVVFHDVTEKRRAQQALRDSERRVRLKLDSILSPTGDVGDLELGDIIDAAAVQRLMDDVYQLARIPMAIIDLKGNVLVGVGWQEICTKFHRVNAESCRNCIESDTELTRGVPPGDFKLYKCRNNMWDVATPLMIGGRHMGNLFTGQFSLDHEPFDADLFREQARRYGFNEVEYLAALRRVPRLSRNTVEIAISFLTKLGHSLSSLSYSNLKLARLLAERDTLAESLKQSGERLNRAQEIAHLGSWELDVRTNELSWSDEVYRIFGVRPQEFGATYEAFLDAVHPEDRAAVDKAYSDSLREGKSSYEITHRVVRNRTGEVRWVHEKCEHERDETGRIVRSLGMVQDITSRKRSEEQLLEASQQRRLALEAAELGAWDYRFDTGDVFWDARCRNMFGFEQGGTIGYADAIARIHPDDRDAVDQAVKQAIAGVADGAYHREFRVVWPDGMVRWIASHGRAYFEGKGPERKAVRFVGANMDITERKQTEENLRQAQKLESIGLLAGGIAHDFNNLLVGVIGNASLAEDLIPPGSPAADLLKRVVRAGEQAAHLTRQMLAYAGKGRFLLERVDLSEVVRSNTSLVQSSLSKKIECRLELASGIPAVESDPSQMQQVFMNLVLNAGEALGGARGVVTIRTGELVIDSAYIRRALQDWSIEPGWYVFLEVSDTGCGMDEETQRRIYDPFFTTKFQGRGLGLAAVAGIVRTNKGAIALKTEPGAGTTFRVLLPAATGLGSISAKPAEEAELRGHGTVLVVDDEHVVREFAKSALERCGYQVLLADSGPAAIDMVRQLGAQIGAVVLDLSMPGMSGEETLPYLRDLKPDLEVIVSSGYSQAEALRPFDGLRVSGFVQKPYGIQQLVREVAVALQTRS